MIHDPSNAITRSPYTGKNALILAAGYAAAIRKLEGDAWAGIRCQHGVLLVEDCDDCEPLLVIPGFEPEEFLLEHDERRRGGIVL